MHINSHLFGEVFFALCKSINSSKSLMAWILFKSGSHEQLANLEAEPLDYDDAESFRNDYLVVSFVSKYKGLTTGADLEAVALQKFATSEQHCSLTNERIQEQTRACSNRAIEPLIFLAQQKIAKVLGTFTEAKFDALYSWGPGATNDVNRQCAFVDTKLHKLPISCSPSALPIFEAVLRDDLHWLSVIFNVAPEDINPEFCFIREKVFLLTPTNTIDTVSKNAKTHRIIAKEPRANGFLQKGVGSYIRSRLKRVGIDLNDQSINQRMASRAHLGLATIDLKAASDTVASELVFLLLPVDWAIFLDRIRSKEGLLPGGAVIKYAKFSSMGNGFTFELESLIFWALATSITGGVDTSVYGDDIIVPRDDALAVISLLDWCGFETNKSKTYITGRFFESCGKHYFDGFDVTPIYQKEVVNNVQELIRLGNRIIRCAARFGGYSVLCRTLEPSWRAARRADKLSIAEIPLGNEGDDGWAVNGYDFRQRPIDANLGVSCRVISSKKVELPANSSSLLAWTLRRDDSRGPNLLGVSLSIPFNDTVSRNVESGNHITMVTRWVMPTGQFGLDWN